MENTIGVPMLMWGRPPLRQAQGRLPAVRAERSSAGFLAFICGADCRIRRRALLARTAGGGCPYMRCRQVLPEELPAVDDAAAAHVKQINGKHAVFVVIAE